MYIILIRIKEIWHNICMWPFYWNITQKRNMIYVCYIFYDNMGHYTHEYMTTPSKTCMIHFILKYVWTIGSIAWWQLFERHTWFINMGWPRIESTNRQQTKENNDQQFVASQNICNVPNSTAWCHGGMPMRATEISGVPTTCMAAWGYFLFLPFN